MKKVVIESPFAGDIEKNTAYARLCLADSLSRGESPIASHLLLTQVLDDTKPDERNKGIKAGLCWTDVADAHVFYVDYGISDGMMAALEKTTEQLNRSLKFTEALRPCEIHFRKILNQPSYE